MRKELLADAVNEIASEFPGSKGNVEDFFNRVSKRFLEKRLDDFPRICDVARVQNLLKQKELEETSNKGRFTDSYGWSADRTFKFDYEIPDELYLFMVNMVYKDFWSNENEKVWRPFMKKVCSQSLTNYDAMQLLIKTKQIYGSNKDLSLIV